MSQLNTTALVILAGGRGTRLGGVLKSSLVVGGVDLLSRIVGAVPNETRLLISIGPHDPAAFSPPRPAMLVPDLPGDAGPLAGIRAAAKTLEEDASVTLLASVAVDSPFLPDDFVPRLTKALAPSHRAAVARVGTQAYPTNAIFRLDALRAQLAVIPISERLPGLKYLLERLGAVAVDWPEGKDGHPFASLNTPADLGRAEARALGHGPV